MSYWTSVAITTREHAKVLAALKVWADEQERSAGFSHVDDGSIASDAWVIVGHVNHLDHDSLLDVIRETVWDAKWGFSDPVGVTVFSEEGAMWFTQLGDDGTWR